MVKMFEQTVESELEDSLGEYETAAERNSRDRRADVVRDVICDSTPLKCQFLGPKLQTKNCNHARRDMEEPRQLPRSLTKVRASDKNTLRHRQGAQKTQVWLPANIAEHTRPDIWPPSSPNCSPFIYFVRGARGQ